VGVTTPCWNTSRRRDPCGFRNALARPPRAMPPRFRPVRQSDFTLPLLARLLSWLPLDGWASRLASRLASTCSNRSVISVSIEFDSIEGRCQRLLARYAPIPNPDEKDISTPLGRRQDQAGLLEMGGSWQQSL
jgi:hypothetical protein